MLYSDATAAQYADYGLSNIHIAENLQPAQLATLHLHVDNNGNYPIVIVADEAMMRGVDYRSDGKGLLLVINKTFSTKRDAEQGLARVGRFGDVCVRFLVKGVELVDRTPNRICTAPSSSSLGNACCHSLNRLANGSKRLLASPRRQSPGIQARSRRKSKCNQLCQLQAKMCSRTQGCCCLRDFLRAFLSTWQ